MSTENRIGRYANDRERWTAVLRRDPKADGTFYFSVDTTGVYCRPSCAARRARRENVRFHATCEAAERAGFRACKRCQPNGPALAELHASAVAEACRAIETSGKAPDLGRLARAANMSRFHFHRVFTKMVGLTPKAYAVARRAERMRRELPRHDSVTAAIYEAGFNSNGRFYAQSGRMLGMAPRSFRRGGAGVAISFSVGKCSLGSILVAATDRGVCAILLGDGPNQLVRDLELRFPHATLTRGGGDFERMIAAVVEFVEAPKIGLNLPLDVRGTAFQQRVWKALRDIPVGSTTSYAAIAKRIGVPKAVRAVAGAVAANPIAVAIPCHRVLHSDGGISGYRWGVKRKRTLLKREAM